MKDGYDYDTSSLDTIKKYISQNNENEPFYILDLNKVAEQYNKWISNLPNITPYFAIKANPDLKIIKLLAELGCNFDCASKTELATIMNIVNDPGRIIFANPCKFPSHISYAKSNNISLMTFDCLEELDKIHTIYPDARLILRICVDDSNSKCKFNSKFGCKLEDIACIFQKICYLKLNLAGFSFHVGSGCEDPISYYKAIRDCRFAYTEATKYGLIPTIIDIGGGFSGRTRDVSFEEICYNIKRAQHSFFKSKIDTNKITFIAEPGRFFTEAALTLVINVIAKKKEGSCCKYYLGDGVYGSFNCIHYDHQVPQLLQVSPTTTSETFKTTFFGPTCDSMDVLYKDIEYPELQVGDWLYVKNYGSYTNAPSSSFNGFCVSNYEYISPAELSTHVSDTSSDSSFSF
jgi:ornithine decarboxylase